MVLTGLAAFDAPRALLESDRLDEFNCGEAPLDDWLKRRALSNQLSGASRLFVVTDPSSRVRGYYALAAGAVAHREPPGAIRRNMPDPVPVMVLGRLAVDRRAQGHQLGGALLQDAVKRVRAASQHVGIRAILVHALNEDAKRFYEHFGFQVSPMDPMLLLLKLSAPA